MHLVGQKIKYKITSCQVNHISFLPSQIINGQPNPTQSGYQTQATANILIHGVL